MFICETTTVGLSPMSEIYARFSLTFILLLCANAFASEVPQKRPNIVLVVFEDMSPRIGALGDSTANTPTLDQIASESLVFKNAFTTSGVCAPSRSSLITGVHQQSLGTHHMRTKGVIPGLKGGGPIEYEAVPPAEVKAFPELLRRAGYYTSNNGKTDYQFGNPSSIWDISEQDANWQGRSEGQPFFAMINIMQTHESYLWPSDRKSDDPLVQAVTKRNQTEFKDRIQQTNPNQVTVPPYLPDTPVVRRDIATVYDNITFSEQMLRQVMESLESAELLDETIVIVTSDHGDGLPRMKRSVYDSGIHVPLMVRFPTSSRRVGVEHRLVSFVDLAPTILGLAGLKVPDWYQGIDIFGSEQRSFVFAAEDRHDSVMSRTKAVRSHHFKYIRNYVQEPVLRPLAFRDHLPTMQEIWRLNDSEGLNTLQSAWLQQRPAEELYALTDDPHETKNLATDPRYASNLQGLRESMDHWIEQVADLSAVDEVQMINQMWPDGIQPITSRPVLKIENNLMTMTSSTNTASISYLIQSGSGEPNDWQLYTGPTAIPNDAEKITVIAERYGYRVSDEVVFVLPNDGR
jgi:arylsulfatase A-like enzyme